MIIINNKNSMGSKALQKLYAMYYIQISGQPLYYPERRAFSFDFARANFERSQQYYSDYMPAYISKTQTELNVFTINSMEYNSYMAQHIQPFYGMTTYPASVTPDFALVMLEDRLNIFKSGGYGPMEAHCPEMAAALTQYRVEAVPNYLIQSELLSCFPEQVFLFHGDLAMQCAVFATTGSLSCLLEGVDLDFVGLLKLLSYQNLLIEAGWHFPSFLKEVLPATASAAGITASAAGITASAADITASATTNTVAVVADYLSAGSVPTGSVPPVDPLPFPTVDFDATDTGSNNTGSPKPGFPFYSCIFGVLLVGVLIKTIFF
jgi:hypothetical protein